MRLDVEKVIAFAGGREAMEKRWTAASQHNSDVQFEMLCALTDGAPGVPFRLAFGTLLGAVRDGDLLPHDKDVDIILTSYDVPAFQERLLCGALAPLEVCRVEQGFITLCSNGAHLDIYVYMPSPSSYPVYTYCGWNRTAWDLPFAALDRISPVALRGRVFDAPSDPERVLERWYGDSWRLPNYKPHPPHAYDGSAYTDTRACLINVGVGRGYPRGQDRLVKSISEVAPEWPTLMYKQWPPGCPPHSEAPYAFKHHAIRRAEEAGHKVIIWIDASCILRKPPVAMVAAAQKHGYAISIDGWNCAQWNNDLNLEYFGVSRDRAESIPTCIATSYALDLSHPNGRHILAALEDAQHTFPGAWNNDDQSCSADPRCMGHRHDQAALSMIAWRLGLPLYSHPNFFSYNSPNIAESVAVVSVGI